MDNLLVTNTPDVNKTINSIGSSVTMTLSSPLIFDSNKKYQLRLIQANIVYCTPNIGSAFNNNKLEYNVDGVNYTITFPNGLYAISEINNTVSLFTLENNQDASLISFIANEANSTIYLYADTPIIIYASHANSIMQILGFAATDITLSSSGYVNGENQAMLNTLQNITSKWCYT